MQFAALINMSFKVRPWPKQWHNFWLSNPFGLDIAAIDRRITSKKASGLCMQIIRHWAVDVLLLLNSVATSFLIWTSGINVFSSHQESNV